MAKKHPIYRLHKIKIHHNRWFIWAIAYVIIVAIAMVGYIKVSEIKEETQNAESVYQPWHNYNDAKLGFGVRIPADWSIEADASAISFAPTNSSDLGVSISVISPTAEKSLRKSLKISQETEISLDDNPSQKIKNNLENGHSETIILAVHNKKLYVLRGTDSLVQKLLLTFHFE